MTAKEYLGRIRHLEGCIKAKILIKEQIRAMAENTTANLSEKVQTSNLHDQVSDNAIRIVELEELINKDISKCIDLIGEIREKIEILSDDRYKIILSMYYLSNKTFEEVAELINKSYQWVHKLHKAALKELDKILLPDAA